MKTLLIMSLTGGVLALLVMALRAGLGKKLHPRLIYLLWLPVLLSLLIPLRFESPISLRNVPQVRYVEQNVSARMEEPIGYGMVSAPWTEESHEDVTTDTSVSVGTQPDGSLDVEVKETVSEPVLFDDGFSIDAYDILALVWLVGALTVGGYIAVVNLRFRARVRRSRKELAVPWILVRQMGKIKVFVSRAVPSPCLVGLFRPFIVVTPQAIEDESRLVHVLTHERMHKAQLDPFWSLLRMAVLIVHWFNPVVWVAASLSRSDCENACDALTIRALGEDQRVDYGKTLLSFLRAKPTATALVNVATTMAQSRRQIRRRINLIAKKQRYAWLAAVLAVVLTLTGCALTMTAPEETAPDAPAQDQPYSPAKPTPAPEPVETLEYELQDDALREFAASYEQALSPYVEDFYGWTHDPCIDFPELAAFDLLYGRRNEAGDAYILAKLPEVQKASTYSDTYLNIWQETNGSEEMTVVIERIGVLSEPGDTDEVRLDRFELHDFMLVDGIHGIEDALILIPEGSDPVLCDLHTVSAINTERFIRTAYPGASGIKPTQGAYLSVPMLNEETMKATGWSTAITMYLPVEDDLLKNLEFASLEEAALKDFWEDAECMSMIRFHPDGKAENYIMLGSDCLVRYENHRVVGVCRQDVYYERFNGIIRETFGIDPFFYIHSKAYNSPENEQIEMATLSFPNYETGEVLTQTLSRTDSQKQLDQLQSLVFAPDDVMTGGAGCPFGGVLTLKTSVCKYTFHVATDSCGVLCYDGNIYIDYGDQADLLEIFPACDPYSPTYTWTGENAPEPVTLEVLAADAPQWEIYEDDERIQELYDFILDRMATADTEPAKDGDEFLYQLDFRDKNVAQLLHVEVSAGSFKVDGRLYPDKKRELLTLIEDLSQ